VREDLMEKYPEGTPKAYFSVLQIIDEGRVVQEKMIKVNDPLIYKGIYFYQATFGQRPAKKKTEFTIDVIDSKSGGKKTLKTDFDREEKLGSKGKFKIVDYAENVPLNVEGHAKNLGEAVQLALSENGEEPQPVWIFKAFRFR